MSAGFFNAALQRKIAVIALPMVLSNLSVPLLGLTDTAVVGHLSDARYLGGVALGSSVISLLFFLLGFLRMSTTGLTAQAYGANDADAQQRTLGQSMLLALSLALLLLVLQYPLASLFSYSEASADIAREAQRYFTIRIWSAPAALLNLVVIGWFLGRQNARYPMWLLLFSNSVNILLDLVFVLLLQWQVAGVAVASVIADYATLLLGLYYLRHSLTLGSLLKLLLQQWQNIRQWSALFALNRDIFLRSLCLQAVFVFINFQGAAYSDTVVAANAVLLSFLMLVSYAQDGLAYAAESLTGQAIGSKNRALLAQLLTILSIWCLLLAAVFSISYAVAGQQLIALLTSIPEVQAAAANYLPWICVLPLLAGGAYLLDGIFIGATQGKTLRNSMLLAFAGFGLCFLSLQHWQNHALWAALCCFMALRTLSLALILRWQWQRHTFIR